MLDMRHVTQLPLLLIVIYICSGLLTAATADQATRSKRIEVYSLTQNYWDTQYGDTLGDIAQQLLPNNPSKHMALKQDIVKLNPQAFINGDPSRLLANKRLWLPGYMKHADTQADPTTTTVETYSWGNIKRHKE